MTQQTKATQSCLSQYDYLTPLTIYRKSATRNSPSSLNSYLRSSKGWVSLACSLLIQSSSFLQAVALFCLTFYWCFPSVVRWFFANGPPLFQYHLSGRHRRCLLWLSNISCLFGSLPLSPLLPEVESWWNRSLHSQLWPIRIGQLLWGTEWRIWSFSSLDW